ILWAACSPANVPVELRPAHATASVSDDPDDPAVWIQPSVRQRSLILGTNRAPAPNGALVVLGLDGKVRQTLAGIDRPNNVDVEYGLMLQGQATDIAVLTERLRRRLRVFRITSDGSALTDVSSPGGLPVFEGEAGEAGEPMGIALYRRVRDGTVFAIVSRKAGPRVGYLWQYRLEDDGRGRVKATKVREFGVVSGAGEIEAIAVDDALGYVYSADQGDGLHQWHADPQHPDAGRELAHFGRDGFKADREGIAIYARPDGTGYIVCTDQLSGNSEYRLYRREGEAGRPHDRSGVVAVWRGGSGSTEGHGAGS